MQYIVFENGYHKETDSKCYTVTYNNPTYNAFYFKAKEDSKTLDKVCELMEQKGYYRYYIVEDSGVLEDLWEGYEDEETILSYIVSSVN
jgi:hypothetical protein